MYLTLLMYKYNNKDGIDYSPSAYGTWNYNQLCNNFVLETFVNKPRNTSLRKLRNLHRITTDLKVETDIITSIASSPNI
jgi:hypothetical protein